MRPKARLCQDADLDTRCSFSGPAGLRRKVPLSLVSPQMENRQSQSETSDASNAEPWPFPTIRPRDQRQPSARPMPIAMWVPLHRATHTQDTSIAYIETMYLNPALRKSLVSIDEASTSHFEHAFSGELGHIAPE